MMYKLKKLFGFICLKIKSLKYKDVSIRSLDISRDICVDDYVQIPKKCHIRDKVKIGKATYLSPNTIIESNKIRCIY